MTIGETVYINPNEVSSLMDVDSRRCMIMLKAGESYIVEDNIATVCSDVESACSNN